MKYIIIILLFLAPELALSKPSLKLSIWNTGFSSVDSIFPVKLLKNNSLVKQLEFYRNGSLDTTFENLDTGLYQLGFTNVFHREILKDVKVINDTVNWAHIDAYEFDLLKDTFSGFIGMLKDKESLKLTYSSLSCFHGEEQDIIILRSGEGYIAKIYPEHSIYKKQKKGKPLIKVFKTSDIIKFRIFELLMLVYKGSLEGSTVQISFYLRFKDRFWVLEMDGSIRKDYKEMRSGIFKGYGRR